MRATVWGCRGSWPRPGRQRSSPAETSCIEVRLEDGTVLVLDAGTGPGAGANARRARAITSTAHASSSRPRRRAGLLRPVLGARGGAAHLGPELTAPHAGRADLALPLSAALPAQGRGQSRSPALPHRSGRVWTIGSSTIRAGEVLHPGPTVGYRIEEGSASLAYIPDHEPALGLDLEVDPEWLPGYGVAAGATVLLHDAQLTEDEYAARIGWGHSSVDAAVTFALTARAERLVLFHHDPMRGDARSSGSPPTRGRCGRGRTAQARSRRTRGCRSS